MQIVTLDFETYFANDYTLSTMTTEEYVRDPRFEAHGAAVHYHTGQDAISAWYSPDQLRSLFDYWRKNGIKVCMICHHAHFDGLILSHHFGYVPDAWICTLSMGRVVFDSGIKLGLEALASRFGLQPKTVPYDEMRGKHWHEMSPELRQRVAEGGKHDCALTREIADCMLGFKPHSVVPYPFPKAELQVMDMTIRMFTEPVLVADLDLLGEAWKVEEVARQNLFNQCTELMGYQITPEMLRKDQVFADLLREFDVEPDTKITKRAAEKAAASGEPPVEKYAFAKSDYFMQDLLTDEDEDVARLAEARLKAQSSIYMTRIERYGNMAVRGPMCIYLAYAAAHTRRWGGGDSTNFQNLPRPDKNKPQKAALRRALKVPS